MANSEYTVERRYNRYAVYCPRGHKLASYFTRKEAQQIVDKLNSKLKLETNE